MPRYPIRPSLPPLEKTLPDFTSLQADRSKQEQVASLLRQVIEGHRTAGNLIFYSTRDIARFFGVSQNTAAWAVRLLEGEGLLRRLRGSQTLMSGSQVVTRTQIRAVTGLMLWNFAQRFSEVHGALARQLAQQLWPHNIALEIIPHYDLGDNRPDLDECLKKHALDFSIWPFPFDHHKDHLLRLQDRGIRNLIIGVNAGRSSAQHQPQIIVDMASAYAQLLRYWKEEFDIRRVLVIQPREFAPRKRIAFFASMASKMGFDCKIESSSYTLATELLAREKRSIGIALLDEHSSTEFTFYQPAAFVELARRHRILFGFGSLNVPFVPNGELRVERIFIPTIPDDPSFKRPLITAIVKTLTQWCSGDFSSPPQEVEARLWTNGELWRYL